MSEIVGLRDVHEVLFSKTTQLPYTSFIQYGHTDTGYRYEVVCPWCSKTIGEFGEQIQPDGATELSPREVATNCSVLQMKHELLRCVSSKSQLTVRKATKPLNTEGTAP